MRVRGHLNLSSVKTKTRLVCRHNRKGIMSVKGNAEMAGNLRLLPPHNSTEAKKQYQSLMLLYDDIPYPSLTSNHGIDSFLFCCSSLVSKHLYPFQFPEYVIDPRLDAVKISLDMVKQYRNDKDICKYLDKIGTLARKISLKPKYDEKSKKDRDWANLFIYEVKADKRINSVMMKYPTRKEAYDEKTGKYVQVPIYEKPTIKLSAPGKQLLKKVHNIFPQYWLSLVEFAFDLITDEQDLLKECLRATCHLKNPGTCRFESQFKRGYETIYDGDVRQTRTKALRIYPKNFIDCQGVRLEAIWKRSFLKRRKVETLLDLLTLRPEQVAESFTFKQIDYMAIWRIFFKPRKDTARFPKSNRNINYVLTKMIRIANAQKTKQLYEAYVILKTLPHRQNGYLVPHPHDKVFRFLVKQHESFFSSRKRYTPLPNEDNEITKKLFDLHHDNETDIA